MKLLDYCVFIRMSHVILAASMVISDRSINHGDGTIWDTMPNSDL